MPSTGESYPNIDGYGEPLGDIIAPEYGARLADTALLPVVSEIYNDDIAGPLIANDDSYGVPLGTPLGIVDHTYRTSGDTSIQQNKSKDTKDRSQTINTFVDSYGEPLAPVCNTSAGNGRAHLGNIFTKKENGGLLLDIGETQNDKQPSLKNDDAYGIPLAIPLDISDFDIIENTTRDTTIQDLANRSPIEREDTFGEQETKTMSYKLPPYQPIFPNILDLSLLDSSTNKVPSPTTNYATTQNVSGSLYQPSESILPNRKQVSAAKHPVHKNNGVDLIERKDND